MLGRHLTTITIDMTENSCSARETDLSGFYVRYYTTVSYRSKSFIPAEKFRHLNPKRSLKKQILTSIKHRMNISQYYVVDHIVDGN